MQWFQMKNHLKTANDGREQLSFSINGER